jgi:hypothetical protein
VTLDSTGAVPNSSSQTLGAGSYSYEDLYSGDQNYAASTGACEAFTVAGSTVLTTKVENSGGTDVTNSTVPLGTSTHDTASVTQVSGFVATGTVTYSFFDDGTCTGTPASTQ